MYSAALLYCIVYIIILHSSFCSIIILHCILHDHTKPHSAALLLLQAHFQEERQRDRMRAAEESANVSRAVSDSAMQSLRMAQGQMQAKDADNARLRALVAAAQQESGMRQVLT